MLRISFVFICTLVFATISGAQDANYWSSNYGPGGFFMPGAVIAENQDSGVLFYNPALLAHHSNKSAASVSGTVYQFESFKIKDGTGTGYPLKSGGSSVNPLIATNSITLNKKKKPFTLFYAIISRPVIDFEASQRKDDKENVLDDSYSPGTEYSISQYNFQNSVNETGFLVGTGLKITPKFAIGLSMEGQIRKQFYKLDLNSRALVNTGPDTLFPPLVNVSQSYQNSNRTVGGQFRLGFSYELSEAHHLGLVISSPLINVSGSATLLADYVVNNLKIGPINFRLLGNTRQEKLKSVWKMPLSIASGYIYHYKKGQLYIAAEYFGKVKEYRVVSPRPEIFTRPDTSGQSATPILLQFKDARKAILNVALGVSWAIKPLLTGYFSLRTDFSYADRSLFEDNEGYIVNTSCWDNYHCQVGANIIKKKFSLRTGILLTYGHSGKFLQNINFDHRNESNLLLGDVHTTTATHFLAGLMVSYIHNL